MPSNVPFGSQADLSNAHRDVRLVPHEQTYPEGQRAPLRGVIAVFQIDPYASALLNQATSRTIWSASLGQELHDAFQNDGSI